MIDNYMIDPITISLLITSSVGIITTDENFSSEGAAIKSSAFKLNNTITTLDMRSM